MYGEGYGEEQTKIVTLEPDMIIDYLDRNIAIDLDEDADWSYKEGNDLKDMIWNQEENDDGLLSERIKDTLNATKVLVTESLGNVALSPIGDESQTSTTMITLKGYRLLANDDEDFVENNAEIIKVTRNNGGSSLVTIPGNYVPGESDTYEEDNAMSQNVTVTPPTGLMSDYIAYAILAISSLGILISGIILIKKYVLGKNRD